VRGVAQALDVSHGTAHRLLTSTTAKEAPTLAASGSSNALIQENAGLKAENAKLKAEITPLKKRSND